jgi:hypothetical protein
MTRRSGWADGRSAPEAGHVTSDILELQRAFTEAELNADTARLDELLADDFRSIGERGFVLDKRQWIDRHAEFGYLDVEISEVEVRRYERAAIVRCAQRSRATWRGSEMSLSTRVSQTWVEGPKGWRLAGIQFSSLDPA